MPRSEWRKVLFRQFEQANRRPEAPAVFRMGRMLEILLEVDKCPGGLNQSLEKIVIGGLGVEPKMLEHVVGFVVMLIVPAPKISAIERMPSDVAGKIRVSAFKVANELRNSFAFAHEALNFHMPQMMGKPTFPEGPDNVRSRSQE